MSLILCPFSRRTVGSSYSPEIQPKVGQVGNASVVGVDETKLWSMADALRNNMDAAEYKHVRVSVSSSSRRSSYRAGRNRCLGGNERRRNECCRRLGFKCHTGFDEAEVFAARDSCLRKFLTSLSSASNFAVMSSVLTLRLPAIDPRFFYPNPSRPLARRDSHKGLRSLPSCHMTDGRHRNAHLQARSLAHKSRHPEHA